MQNIKKHNVLHVIATNFIGGPEKQIINHLRYNKDKSINISVCSFVEKNQQNQLLRYLKNNNFTVFGINQSSIFDLSMISQLRKIIRENKIDILVTHGYKSNIVGYYETEKKTPQAMYVRGWTSENWKIKIYNFIEKIFLKKAKFVVTVARSKGTELTKLGIDHKKIRYIANAVEMPENKIQPADSLRKKYNFGSESTLFLAAGRLSPEKGHRQLILALEKLNSKYSDFCCVIFGDGFLKEQLVKLTHLAGMKNQIVFSGFDPNWKDYLGETDLLINPSLSEVMPNVVLEGMSYRCPVLATDVGGVKELITDGITGFVAEPGNPQSLYEAILRYMSIKDSINKMTDRAYNHVETNFSFENQASQLNDLYLELLNLKKNDFN